jgi:hypothetical protein
LNGVVERDGDMSTCDYCEGEDEKCVSIDELADYIEGAFERHFERTSSEPDAFQYALIADRELSYQWYRDGSPVAIAISEAAGIDDDVAEDVREILDDRHGDFEMDQMGEETEFSSDSYYEEKGANDIEFQMEWKSVELALKTQARHFNKDAERFLERMFGNVHALQTAAGLPVVVVAGPGTERATMFRARTFHRHDALEHALRRPDFDLGPPPVKFARAGRMNAQGISVFYGAYDAKAAIAEVRPPVGSKVLVGQFELLREVKLLDVEALRSVYQSGNYFDPEYIGQLELARFLGRFSHRVTMPVMPDDEPAEYLITQPIADYLSQAVEPKIDGMMYPSVQVAGGSVNVVLFHHAARVEEWDIPSGTTIEAQTFQTDEDGDRPDYYVTEEVPPPKPAGKEKDDPFDFLLHQPFDPLQLIGTTDDRELSLKLDPKTIVVHHVTAVEFSTDDFTVSRSRRTQHDGDDF